MEVVMDLSGKWSFSIGDNLEWANENFDHSQWQEIHVPGPWESQGYYGYDGTAWYRESFTLNLELNNQNLYLELGYIDDVDEVYINGKKIGFTGSFPPNYKTAYNARRIYSIPKNVLKSNSKNVIAVRVFDEQLEGGILRGNIKLLKERNPLLLDFDLQGLWKFKTGDNENWSYLNDYSDWSEILVPGTWENQGFFNYDGFAWYVIQFKLSYDLIHDDLVVVLGKIDDLDQLYINGEFVASTGQFEERNYQLNASNEYNE
ncbi:MAG: glycoside hydrolase [Marinilabiliales bacterium]|nr:MAG: glycoside hydrolase [Marinilabiliales bacterium]